MTGGVFLGVSIIIGGQYGSEGKGKVAFWYTNKVDASSVIRVGGINSGHTVISSHGEALIFRVLPTSAIGNKAKCILPAGSYISVDLLFKEIKQSGIDPQKIVIDPKSVVVNDRHISEEKNSSLLRNIGSTASGTGVAVSMRVNRSPDVVFAKDVPALTPFILDTSELLRNEIKSGKEIVIEGTQGFGLSNIHTPFYPFATSRDTTAAGFLSETGLSPLDVTNIIMVIRSFPIRVAGNSGPLPKEITWDDVTAHSNNTSPIREYTSVTKRLRRVALFDAEIVKKAISVNNPNIIVLNHLDYIGEPDGPLFGTNRRQFVYRIEKEIGRKIDYIGLDNQAVIQADHTDSD